MDCPHCDSSTITERSDLTTRGYRRFRCRSCGRGFNERTHSHFNRLQYPPDVVCLVVLWRVRYKLSFRDLAEMFLDRGVVFTHEAVRKWEAKRAPVLSEALRKHRRGRVGPSWYCDETYLKVKGRGVYLYRGVDTEGQTIDFFLSEQRDIAAAKQFLQQAIKKRGVPQKITLDGYAASHVAVAELQEEAILPTGLTERTNKYLNNIIEQDHRRVKQRVRPMLGFKRFAHATITISGIELVHQIKKEQFDISLLCAPLTRTPQVWEAVLAA